VTGRERQAMVVELAERAREYWQARLAPGMSAAKASQRALERGLCYQGQILEALRRVGLYLPGEPNPWPDMETPNPELPEPDGEDAK
jgi:hypothetical protein